MATDKVIDVEVMSVDSNGNIACDGGVTATGGIVGDVTGDVTGDVVTETIGTPEGQLVIEASRIGGGSMAIGASSPINPITILIGYLSLCNNIAMPDLPTTDPVIDGALWIDTTAGRVIKVSAGA